MNTEPSVLSQLNAIRIEFERAARDLRRVPSLYRQKRELEVRAVEYDVYAAQTGNAIDCLVNDNKPGAKIVLEHLKGSLDQRVDATRREAGAIRRFVGPDTVETDRYEASAKKVSAILRAM